MEELHEVADGVVVIVIVGSTLNIAGGSPGGIVHPAGLRRSGRTTRVPAGSPAGSLAVVRISRGIDQDQAGAGSVGCSGPGELVVVGKVEDGLEVGTQDDDSLTIVAEATGVFEPLDTGKRTIARLVGELVTEEEQAGTGGKNCIIGEGEVDPFVEADAGEVNVP